jgi:hypothetical protein
MTTPSGRSAPGSTPGLPSATSPSAWRARATTSNSRGTTRKGWRATFYTTRGWSTARRARPAQRGSGHRGARSRPQRAMRCAGRRIASRDSRAKDHARTRWYDGRSSREPQDDESNENSEKTQQQELDFKLLQPGRRLPLFKTSPAERISNSVNTLSSCAGPYAGSDGIDKPPEKKPPASQRGGVTACVHGLRAARLPRLRSNPGVAGSLASRPRRSRLRRSRPS